jgi:transcriptional repressor NrdR
MRCPYCKVDDDRVVDSRVRQGGSVIRRRRQCNACRRRYTTLEQVERTLIRVIKKDGTRVPFEREKVLHGLLKACDKRPVSQQTLEEIADQVEAAVAERLEAEVPSKEIGELVMERLRQVDQVAYVRFASVYREFKDVSEFLDEVWHLDRTKPSGSTSAGPNG